MSDDIKFPHVDVCLIGEDGDVFSIIGRVTRALKRAGEYDAATEYANEVMSAGSYDEALQITMRTVNVN